MEIKLHATKKPISQQRNQIRNLKNTLRQMKMETQLSGIYRMQQNQLWGNIVAIQVNSRNKKNLKQAM